MSISGNAFSKEQIVNFAEEVYEWDTWLVTAGLLKKYKQTPVQGARTDYTIWRPQQKLVATVDGLDQTGNFASTVQLSIPARLSKTPVYTFSFDAKDSNDPQQIRTNIRAGLLQLADHINGSILDTLKAEGTVIVPRSASAQSAQDVFAIENVLNPLGVYYQNRFLTLSTPDYSGLALDVAGRQTMGPIVTEAYRRMYVGNVGGFNTFKLDYAPTQLGSDPTLVAVIDGAGQNYTPVATNTTVNGYQEDVDNRYQTISINVTVGDVAVGDSFTIEDVNGVHHLSRPDGSLQKRSTNALKTFRIIGIPGATTGQIDVVISPPIVSNDETTQSQIQYQNVIPATAPFAPAAGTFPADGASLTFLNTADAFFNPFWQYDAVELMPGVLNFDPTAGWGVKQYTAEKSGLQLTLVKQGNIDNTLTKYAMYCFYGVNVINPEACGGILFSQT